ncbi:MAG: hypothetical protein NTZ78_09210 [Candidatus Aureabacteria bacterium]|nr:hypothetical protein [Candidatus Auribacterota bacterium]
MKWIVKPTEMGSPMRSFPMGVAIGKKGDAVYVADCRHHTMRRFSKKDYL